MKSTLVRTLLIVLILVGCSSEEKRIANVPAEATLDGKPGEQLAALERDLDEARSEGVDGLSPAWFKSAQASIERARAALNEGKNLDEIARHITEARIQLERAKGFASAGKNEMRDVLSARSRAWEAYQAARKAGAARTDELQDELESVENRFRSASRAVEEGGSISSDQQRDLADAYARVTVKATKREKFDLAHRLVNQARQEGASEFAPKALSYANNAIEAAEKYIESAPTRTEEIDVKVDEAVESGQRAVVLAREAKKLDTMSAEARALWVEQALGRLAATAEVELDDTQSFNDRVLALDKGVSAQVAALGPARSEEARLKDEQARLKSAISKSEAQVKAGLVGREAIRKIESLFRPQEAEVLESEGKVILRLRGMRYPVGKSKLGSENFPLLGKVVRALEAFPNATIAVEGHTDATGTEELNLRLSRERAEGVMAYLLSAGAAREGKVSAFGYGFAKPIAENKTSQGRAENRRIDVIITPAQRLAE